MATEFYLWKWADNDLPGSPTQIIAQLASGDLPAALQPFLVRQVYPRLSKVLDRCRSELSEIFVAPLETVTGAARFIRLRHPLRAPDWLPNQLLWAVWDAELTVVNATSNRLIGLPKRNVVELPAGRQLVDIHPADIPGLLQQLAHSSGLAALTCYDCAGNMFQVWAHHRRYAVEWQVLPVRDFNLHRIWVAGRQVETQRRTRFGTVAGGLDLYSRELLELGEVYHLWKSFLAGGQRPPTYHWRDVTRQVQHLDQPPRHRQPHPPSVLPAVRCFGPN
ncbi:MAG: hypothetical protein PCFJNLEI_00516 [Verrucomicrobiae bacterium]|nr:hypothetical protein [Verrucomicrobiae bacterium]